MPEFRDEGLECLNILVALNPRVEFNYVTATQPEQLELPQWQGAAAFTDWLASTELPFIEVFAKSR